jgi:hypothetical protein
LPRWNVYQRFSLLTIFGRQFLDLSFAGPDVHETRALIFPCLLDRSYPSQYPKSLL